MPEINKESYLGDGLYVSWDGWQIKLRAPRMWKDHEVYLEPRVYVDFKKYGDECMEELKRAVEKAREADRRAKDEARAGQEPSPGVPEPESGT